MGWLMMAMQICGVVVLVAPMLLLCVLGIPALLDRQLSERQISWAVLVANSVGLAAAVCVLAGMLLSGERSVPIELGTWVGIPNYHFAWKFVFDRLSVPFVILSFSLIGVIGAFADQYMHREPGYSRFFMLYSIFLAGMIVTSLAGTIETLFSGWELVGLSSAFLVAFFHERESPVRNGQVIWSIYRVSDAALLLAALTLHHQTGEGDFGKLMVSGTWPDGEARLTEAQAILVGGLILLAAAGKSALVPFSGWLPRAMEGPTPSSAVFYGALSVHLGAFLLLRVSPVLERSWMLGAATITLGLATALCGAVCGRVQTDIKSVLCYASLTQVGIIVAEIGIGWRYIPLIHILGHACLRILQFVRAPSLLQDYRAIENAIGGSLPSTMGWFARMLPTSSQHWLYRFALERCYLDGLLARFVVSPVLAVFHACDRYERQATAWLNGRPPTTTSPSPAPITGGAEELL